MSIGKSHWKRACVWLVQVFVFFIPWFFLFFFFFSSSCFSLFISIVLLLCAGEDGQMKNDDIIWLLCVRRLHSINQQLINVDGNANHSKCIYIWKREERDINMSWDFYVKMVKISVPNDQAIPGHCSFFFWYGAQFRHSVKSIEWEYLRCIHVCLLIQNRAAEEPTNFHYRANV